MTVAAVLPERVVCVDVVASRFAGGRARLVDGPRRIDPVRCVVDDDGLDLPRLLSRVASSAPNARRALPLVRRSSTTQTPTTPTTETAPFTTIASAWCAALVARGVTALAFVPRLMTSPHFNDVAAAAKVAGLAVQPLSPLPTSTWLLDDAELVDGATFKVVADAGQGAMFAAGLVDDVVGAIIELGGGDARDLWDKGYDDVARCWFTQRIERALRTGTTAVSLTSLLPPLSASTSKLAALQSLPEASAKAIELAATLRQRQRQQRDAVAACTIGLRLPATRASWWQERLADLVAAGDRVAIVAAEGSGFAALAAALTDVGVVVDEPAPSWLAPELVDASVSSAPAPIALPTPTAVGGIRSGDAFVLDDEPAPAPAPIAASVVPVVVVDEHRTVPVPRDASDVVVTVDGVAVDVRRAGDVVELALKPRSGSVVVVSWNAPEPA